MLEKEVRIVIADTSLPRLIQLEKSLDRLGYHRILPVQVFEDLWALTHKLNDTSYVLIANKDLALDTKFDWIAFCQTTRKINHALLYKSHPIELISISLTSSRAFSTRCVGVPNDELIGAFMISVNPTSPWEATWTNSPCETNSQLLALENNDIPETLKPSK